MADHRLELMNTNLPPGTGGGNVPSRTPKQPWNTGGWEIDDGRETSVTSDGENLDLERRTPVPRRPVRGSLVLTGKELVEPELPNSGFPQQRALPEKKNWSYLPPRLRSNKAHLTKYPNYLLRARGILARS
ncbi:hypothetical protein PIB30_010480 [Stylosanthes scabra]|uniref:Uncharacterized protein n=1 Tax=Stylosanthes scabra TaxID=79078 RepID=A0ABU6Z611_9FABA|nr:hypothetical protein [Stylosanthes scabra]